MALFVSTLGLIPLRVCASLVTMHLVPVKLPVRPLPIFIIGLSVKHLLAIVQPLVGVCTWPLALCESPGPPLHSDFGYGYC